jgi:hypothetical protein
MTNRPLTTRKWPYITILIVAPFALSNFMDWAMNYTIATDQQTLFANLDVLAMLIFTGVGLFCIIRLLRSFMNDYDKR